MGCEVASGGLHAPASTSSAAVLAAGSASGIKLSLALLRPLGTLVLKSTVSLNAKDVPGWSELANDIVVNEKQIVGSRCAAFPT